MIDRKCPNCGKVYSADENRLKHGRQTTCSRKCSYQLRSDARKVELNLKCQWCKKKFTRKKSEVKGKSIVVCSQDCYKLLRAKGQQPFQTIKDSHCESCKKPFTKKNRTHKYCSRECFFIEHKKNMSGSGGPNWQGGISKFLPFYRGDDWHEIRRKVYARDKYICQKCGVKCISRSRMNKRNSKRLIQCHHKISYRESKDNSMENLETLCISCHMSIENKGR